MPPPPHPKAHKYTESLGSRERKQQVRLHIKSLQLLRAVLHREIKMAHDIIILQDQLADLKAINEIVLFLSWPGVSALPGAF